MGLAIRNDSVTPRLAMVLQLGSEVLVRAGYGLGIYRQNGYREATACRGIDGIAAKRRHARKLCKRSTGQQIPLSLTSHNTYYVKL
jgi:hypothetical protein